MIERDSGTEFVVTIQDDTGIVDMSGATAVIRFVRPDNSYLIKDLTVVDASAGKCSAVLSDEDLNKAGIYTYQVTVSIGGKSFSSPADTVMVGRYI